MALFAASTQEVGLVPMIQTTRYNKLVAVSSHRRGNRLRHPRRLKWMGRRTYRRGTNLYIPYQANFLSSSSR